MKRFRFLLAFLLFLLPAAAVAEIPQPGSAYANDYANVLKPDTVSYINQTSAKYNGDGTQVVVVTVKNLDGMAVEEYANKLFRSWGIGDKTKKNGLLILLSTEDRKIRVEVGDGLEGILNDGKVGRIIDAEAMDALKKNDFDTGIRKLYDGLLKVLGDPQAYPEEKEAEWPGLVGALILLILLWLFMSRGGGMFLGGHRRGGWGGWGGWGGPTGDFVGGTGGFGGGGFSGGGGSSSGGGASRGF